MSDTLPLRPYQRAAIDALHAGWAAGQTRLAVLLPTGAGKTVTFAHLAAEKRTRNVRTLVLAHREELIEQAAAKIRSVAPHLAVGICKAERNEIRGTDVIVASVQTLANERRRRPIQGIGLVVVDEAHHAAAPSYLDVLGHFGAFDGTPTAGFTATMTREAGGLGNVWQDIVYRRDILEMIADGHLVDVRGKSVRIEGLSLDAVKTRAGDLMDGQLGRALENSGAAHAIADAYAQHASDRAGVVFTPTVATARQVAATMTQRGIQAAAIWGDMDADERKEALKRYQAGDVQVLTNCMVLTEGWDAPWASCAVIARPTKSPGLYVQMVGRVLRPSEGKRDALVLDVMGAATRHKLASLADLTSQDLTRPRDGESLREAAQRSDQDDVAAPGRAAGAVRVEDIDLFGRSPVRWLQTRRGTWFVPIGSEYLLLVPGEAPQTYRIRRWSQHAGLQEPTPDPSYPLEGAMHWTQVFASRINPQLSQRTARWRSGPPSPKQLTACRRAGLTVPPGASAGDVADAMDRIFASRALDRVLAA
ncbi:DEAD/DEAH box helicase [Streptomyces carpaticus]|uniref:DEAD/DEAH box helicase n=1 Tax=Streptomyces carpaticus TaxID=285558 RepID=UPI0031F9BA6E